MLETMDLETWLPGKVMEIHGSILHTTLLRDGRGICQHADQLRSHEMVAVAVPGVPAVLALWDNAAIGW